MTMAKDLELDRLKAEEQRLFQAKQEAFQSYAKTRDATRDAYERMENAWRERDQARSEMNREFEVRKEAYAYNDAIWSEYSRIRDTNNARIDSLKHEADYEHQAMQDSFERASSAYQYGDKSEAPYYAAEGREHQARRNELNAEVSALAREVREARERAESMVSRVDSTAFERAKSVYEQAKSVHELAEAEFKRLREGRDRLKSEFDRLHAEYGRAKEAFLNRLAEVKAARERKREKALDKAGVRWSERGDAKIVQKADGSTQVYHGGLGSGDGLGHGHTVLDKNGEVTYNRDAFAARGGQNYVEKTTTLAVGTDMYRGMPAKVRERKDGKWDIFFNSSGNYGDGLGHGHIVVDADDSVHYMRDEWQGHGDYLIDDGRSKGTDHTKI